MKPYDRLMLLLAESDIEGEKLDALQNQIDAGEQSESAMAASFPTIEYTWKRIGELIYWNRELLK